MKNTPTPTDAATPMLKVLEKPMSIRLVQSDDKTVAIMQGDDDSRETDLQWANRIVRAVNLLAAYEAMAVMTEKLRLAINPLLVELPDKSVVNGEDNFPFRLKILKLQVEAETALAQLAKLKEELK